MRVLLDTHAFLCWVLGDHRLSTRAASIISDEAEAIHVCAITDLEIAINVRLLKLPEAAVLIHRFEDELVKQEFKPIAVLPVHACEAGLLRGPDRDPFDRIIAAQARVEDLSVISRDLALDRLGATRIW